MLWTSLAALAVLSSAVLADVKFTDPTGGATLDVKSPVDIEWTASDDLTTYQLWLCAGGNEEGKYVRDGCFKDGLGPGS
jgi:hypothetical protein